MVSSRYLLTRAFTFLLLFLSITNGTGQPILLDGLSTDWSGGDLFYDDKGDFQSLDIESLTITYDDVYVYFKIDLNQEILLQQDNNIKLGLDIDNNPNSGKSFGNIGADLTFNFGSKSGILYLSQGIFIIGHNDIGLIAAPTVSSSSFEIGIRRKFTASGIQIEMSDQIAIHLFGNNEGGDQIPDSGQLMLSMSSNRPIFIPKYYLPKKPEADFRFMSYNALRDNIFENNVAQAFEALMRAVAADIYCFQEVYMHNDRQLVGLLEDRGAIDRTETWYSAKHGPDIITISRYPIIFERAIGNNGVVVVDIEGKELMIINTHLPCCENDMGREQEIDLILEFIRKSKTNETGYFLQEDTPYLICGDMNLVGWASQLNSLITGDIKNNTFYGPDVQMDWDENGMADVRPFSTGFNGAFTWYDPSSSFYPGRLDLILYTDAILNVLNAYVLNSAGLNQSEQVDFQINDNYSVTTSDHMPVVSDFKFRIPSAIEEFEKSVVMYPNPVSGQLCVDIPDSKIKSLTIYDVQGRKMKDVLYPPNCFPLDIQSGIYILLVTNEAGHLIQQKIVVE